MGPFKIERALTGLFEHLKLRSMGELPTDVAPYVQPTIDLNQWAFQANGIKTTRIVPATAVVAVGSVGTFTQPNDWLVVGACGAYQAGGVGEFAFLQLLAAPSPSIAGIEVATSQKFGSTATMTSLVAGELFITNWMMPNNGLWFFPAGTLWALNAHSVQAPTGVAYATVLHYSL